MAAGEVLNKMEREAICRIREIFSGGREASLTPAKPEEEAFVQSLSELALYPEKPILFFNREHKGEESETIWQPEKDEMDFFGLAEKFKGKRNIRKLITCGGVDDGKSTLIGRILYDTKRKEEQEAICGNPDYLRKDGSVDFALLAGTTEEEARQGITVQVSYSIFDWEELSFFMADVPGHEEYTRNMAYAASKAETAIIMTAANKGIVPQTRRHTRICYFMGIRSMIFAVNKMDMVSFEEKTFLQLSEEIDHMMAEFEGCAYQIVPVAAKSGRNVREKAAEMPWYQGRTLLAALKQTKRQTEELPYFCMPVQRTCKSSQMKGAVVKKRVVQGEVVSGSVKTGDEIFVYPTGGRAKVLGIYGLDRQKDRAQSGESIGITFDKELDAARGYILAGEDAMVLADRIEADILWTSDSRLTQGRRYRVKLGTAMLSAVVTKICYQSDVNTGEHRYAEYLTKNDLARCELCFSRQAALVCEKENRMLGTFCLFEREADSLAAYGNIVQTISEEAWKENGREVLATERESALGQKAGILLFEDGIQTKECVNYIERNLLGMGFHTIQIAPAETDARDLAQIRTFLDAGLIVLLFSKEAKRECLTGLLEEKKRIFDCGKNPQDAANMGKLLKKIKLWASELI